MTTRPTTFRKLNQGWNADPNAPFPKLGIDRNDLVLKFHLNHFVFPGFDKTDVGYLRFQNCSRYRLGATNDEGWFRGQCRFSKIAPDWGEFYEISGDLKEQAFDIKWENIKPQRKSTRHFLFYFRDETFECGAENWTFENMDGNALLAIGR